MSERRHDVFISHSSKDKPTADAICGVLERHGIRCWIAPRDILPGQEWAQGIIQGILASQLLVLVFSGNANLSPQVRREVERAAHNELPIIPFRIEDVPPHQTLEFFISSRHWIDALTPPLEAHIEQLADAIKRLLDRKAAPRFRSAERPDAGQGRAAAQPVPATACLRVERVLQASLAGSMVDLFWNGERVGELPGNQTIELQLPPGTGKFQLGMRHFTGREMSFTDPISLDLVENRTTFVRLKSDLNLYGYPAMNFWVDTDPQALKRKWSKP